MAQTLLLTPGTTTAQSADVAVTQTTPALFAAYTDVNPIPNNFQLTVVQKTPTGYQQYYISQDRPAVLSAEMPQLMIIGVGTFAIQRTGCNFNLGVSLDQ